MWADLNPSLMAARILGNSSGGLGRPYSLCLSADHSKDDCTLASLESTAGGSETSLNHRVRHLRQPCHPCTYGSESSEGVCYQFNWVTCVASRFLFKHFCSNSQKTDHTEISCPEPEFGTSEGERQGHCRQPYRGQVRDRPTETVLCMWTARGFGSAVLFG